MTRPKQPDDFDWVPARKACSEAVVFERLLQLAKRDVAAAAETVDGRVSNPVEFHEHADTFFVLRHTRLSKRGVRFFQSYNDRAIVAEPFGESKGDPVTATLTINNDGECRLLVNGTELQAWQFLKRMLEPVIFPADR